MEDAASAVANVVPDDAVGHGDIAGGVADAGAAVVSDAAPDGQAADEAVDTGARSCRPHDEVARAIDGEERGPVTGDSGGLGDKEAPSVRSTVCPA